ncbi:hypothetical protein [Sphingobium scionense]|uniref:Uncharacterized protein n=1 Tax=Sphingobium scionense TaxID=1404341 RepID=A0A7W6LQZ0_9SPHN|nr:hypothetical protein [Sphingobium scionense]MBB4147968.1 hypothetical protein [Sphingobium scionense]
MNWRRIFARRRPALSLDALVAATRAANAPWAAKRRAQLPAERQARIRTIIETGVRPSG